MKAKNLKIGTQLKLGFAAVFLFVIILGAVSYYQTYELHRQTEDIYNHPLQVRKAIDLLENDIWSIRVDLRDLMLAEGDAQNQTLILSMELAHQDALKQFDTLKALYLGPASDIDEAYQAYVKWTTARQENVELALAGELAKVRQNLLPEGYVGVYRYEMMAAIEKIDQFAKNKADDIYSTSVELNRTLNWQLTMLVGAILFLSLLIYYILLRNIRKPLSELTLAAEQFHNGDPGARSTYDSKNEFGLLSFSFNTLAASIEASMELNKKASGLAEAMLSVEDAREFFKATLNALLVHTGSQMAAVYLLSEDKKTYDHFESIGLNSQARQSFAADNPEGEFGPVLSTLKLQHISNIPDDTRFLFHTVNGKFVPREIITIPVLSGDLVAAIISLASVSKYNKQAIDLINSTLHTMSARIEGVLAYRTIKDFKETLELQNRELDIQKTELTAQTSELMQQNIELEMQKKQLDEASRLKTNFLSNMSHELRTPLNSVIALSGVLNRRLANRIPEEEYGYLEVIERNGKNLLLLINDILDISRIESGREEVEISRFNLNVLIDDVVDMLQPQAVEKNIGLSYLKDDPKIFTTSDEDKCLHILQNIIGNAVKFTEEGQVEISARQSGEKIKITVIDTGVGIAEKDLPYIFDEFRQADDSTSRKYGGTGLGLAIAQKYANMLGGTILAKSSLNKGSEFIITLPLDSTAHHTTVESEIQTENRLTSRPKALKSGPGSPLKTILLVEDSEPAIIQIKDLMEESGYRMLVARGAEEAFGIIDQFIPDAIILDLMMPGADGFEVLKSLREAEPTAHIPVIILTAKHISKEELKVLKQNHVHQLIQKGDVNRIELQNAVASMLFPETAAVEKPRRERQTIEGKPLVLIVEDNPDNLTSVKALLAAHYAVLEAADGYEGVEKAGKYKPNLILMDISLPGMNGIEAFQAIRKQPVLRHIPVIALTASAMTHDRETILSYGFDAFLAKPIIEKEFYEIISEVLYGK